MPTKLHTTSSTVLSSTSSPKSLELNELLDGAPAAVPLYRGRKAVVVGAGPAGSTAAMFLAKQGFMVEVFEKRPDPEDDPVDPGRAYIIILIPRGQSALEELKIPLPTDPNFLTQGTVRHQPNGKLGITKEPGNVTFSRSGLAQFLISEARTRFPDNIKFHFNATLDNLDITEKQAEFQVVGGETMQRNYDLCIGADGVGSKVRDFLRGFIPGFRVQISDSGREYKVYRSLRADIEPPEFKGKPGSTLHLYTTKDPFTTVTAHSNPDGSYTGTFSLRAGGFDKLKTAADHETLLKGNFVGLPTEWIPEIASQVAGSTPSSAGKRIKCSQINGPGIILLGDAAHGVTPVFGQGANSALESCRILDEVLTKCNGVVESVPPAFNTARLEDVHALYELDRKAFSFFARRGPLDPDFLQLLAHIALGTALSKLVPFLYGDQPALAALGSRMPYSVILRAVRRDALAAALGFVALLLFGAVKYAAGVVV
ncbi:MAG: hypothetical protein WDW38_004963 [Sanguina aurantia]